MKLTEHKVSNNETVIFLFCTELWKLRREKATIDFETCGEISILKFLQRIKSFTRSFLDFAKFSNLIII
jgi:hypothetical protein